MNIIIIPAFFQERRRPTLGSFFWDQARALKMAGHEVSLLYCDAYSVKFIKNWLVYPETTIEMKDGITIYRNKCFCPLKHGMKGYKQEFSKVITSLYEKYLLFQKVDIIHAHCSVWAGYAAMNIWKKYKVPYVVTEHATLFQLHRDTISKTDDLIIKEVFQNAATVICVSGAFKRLLENYRKDIKVIGNVVDCTQFQIIKESQNKKFTFLCVCYMQTKQQLQKKGIDILLKAWEKIVKMHQDVRLVIGGGGKALETVENWCRESHVTDSVELLGALNRSQVVEQMQNCDCFVLPSRYETFGVVYIEAMACGKPIIGVRNGGPDDFVNADNGILIDSLEIDSLVDAMQEMIRNVHKYDNGLIRQEMLQKFSYDSIAKQLEAEYQMII